MIKRIQTLKMIRIIQKISSIFNLKFNQILKKNL